MRGVSYIFITVTIVAGTGIALEWGGGYISQTAEVYNAYDSLKKVSDLQEYFDKKKGNFKKIKKLAKERHKEARILVYLLIRALKSAIEELDNLAHSEIRFHPQIFNKATEQINETLRSLLCYRNKEQEICRLYDGAEEFEGSGRFSTWLGEKISGVKNADELIKLSRDFKSLIRHLKKIKLSMAAVADHNIEGYSNNFLVDYITKKSKGGERPESCVDLSSKLKRQDIIDLQSFLIAKGHLEVGGNDGSFGGKTKRAVEKYQRGNLGGQRVRLGAVGPATRYKMRCK